MKIFDAIEHGNLSCNQINVPSIIGAFESLCDLDLSKNLDIPQSFKQVEELDQLDLSNNNLSDVIPKFLEALLYIKCEIPSGGRFANYTAKSILDNEALSRNPIFGVHFIQFRVLF
ncbi:receptor-like protein cf-9 like protein [Quercus suber]|uniref:Receptor-like protein cf-9 like protein n=1 Tax=Quercus suber TaxID=58331 RepID=A0AAW0K6D5_QUESU